MRIYRKTQFYAASERLDREASYSAVAFRERTSRVTCYRHENRTHGFPHSSQPATLRGILGYKYRTTRRTNARLISDERRKHPECRKSRRYYIYTTCLFVSCNPDLVGLVGKNPIAFESSPFYTFIKVFKKRLSLEIFGI